MKFLFSELLPVQRTQEKTFDRSENNTPNCLQEPDNGKETVPSACSPIRKTRPLAFQRNLKPRELSLDQKFMVGFTFYSNP